MIRRFPCGTVIVAILMTSIAAPLRAEKLSKVEIGKRGKAATALVEIKPGQARGTAFCVNPSGLFVTTEQVARASAAGAAISLVLDSGLKTQKTFAARVVRSDADLGLALLRAQGARDLPSLALGTDAGLSELADVFLFGFPPAAPPDKKDYPAISANASSVTSLHKKDGRLYRIEMDQALSPSYWGGPVLDERGEVVGVIAPGGQHARTSQALPVDDLARWLITPEMEFQPPELGRDDAHRPVDFQARVTMLLPTPQPPGVELVLRSGDGKERRQKMEFKDGVYHASVVPVPRGGDRHLQLTARYDGGMIAGAVNDREFKVGDAAVKLSAISRLEFQPRPRVVLSDGKRLEGPLSGLEAVEVRVGDQPLTINLSKAVAVELAGRPEAASVDCTLSVSLDGKEIGRLQTSVRVLDKAPPAQVSTPVRASIKRAPLKDDQEERPLPSTMADVCVGGGGRYLIFHLPKERKLAVFDANEARVVKYLAVAEDDVRFAAGIEKLIVALPIANVLQRWDLGSFEREVSVPTPVEGTVANLVMGSASRGPLLICLKGDDHAHRGAGAKFVDPLTFKPIELKWTEGSMPGNAPELVRASADGTVFAMRTGIGGEPHEVAVITVNGNQARSRGAWLGASLLLPSPDGRYLYTSDGIYNTRLDRLYPKSKERGDAESGPFVPARHGDLFMKLEPRGDRHASSRKDGPDDGNISLLLPGQYRPIAALSDVEGVVAENLSYGGKPSVRMHHDKRVHLIPDAKLLVTIPSGNDRLILRRFDLDALLAQSDTDYLFVTSQPPLAVARATTLAYQVAVRSKRGGVKYKLESGPAGMAVSPAGQLTWAVPPDFAEAGADVILTVTDASGQEIFHTFQIAVSR